MKATDSLSHFPKSNVSKKLIKQRKTKFSEWRLQLNYIKPSMISACRKHLSSKNRLMCKKPINDANNATKAGLGEYYQCSSIGSQFGPTLFQLRRSLRSLCRSRGRGCRLCTSGSLGRPETRSTFCSWSSCCATGAAQTRCTCCPRDLRQRRQSGDMSELLCQGNKMSLSPTSCP